MTSCLGIRFLKYGGLVGGIVVDTPSGHVASFNDAPGCEFCGSGARIAFSALQRSVSLHVGLLPVTGVTVQQDLRLTGLDAGGMTVATAIANVTAGAGFDTTLDLVTAEPRIATVVLEAVNDPALLATIAVRDITFEETTGGQADFFLIGPLGETLVQGGAAADIPVTIMRIGGSSGAIGFTLSQLPAGVTGSVSPNPSLGTGITCACRRTRRDAGNTAGGPYRNARPQRRAGAAQPCHCYRNRTEAAHIRSRGYRLCRLQPARRARQR